MEFHSQTASALSSSRPLANYHPNVWGNTFLLKNDDIPKSDGDREEELIEELKEKVGRELKELNSKHDYVGQIKMVDAIQRLGIAYHFETEIDEALRNLFGMFDEFCKHNHDDMYAIALCFRLLRQHGYRVSSKIFEGFKDDNGEFITFSHGEDNMKGVMGMLEFYEATHLRVHDEDVLEDGFAYATNYLKSILPNLSSINPAVAKQVDHALNRYSNRRGLTRLEARLYIPIYAQSQHDPSHHPLLLTLAILDFNSLQNLHRRELSQIYKWWKGLDAERKLPYVRDRMVEIYFWNLGVYFEPEFRVARKILARVHVIISIFYDTYDAYGTFEELQVLTEAIERWDMSCLDKLPVYMHVFYKALLNLFQEIEEEEVVRQAGSYRVAYGKEAVKEMARAYFDEFKWKKEKYTPTMEEYMALATRTCAYTSLIILSFLGINGDIAKKEAFDWVLSQPAMVRAACIICRLADDIVGYEFEKKRDHIPTAVELCMKEKNVTKEEAIADLKSQIESAWKDINEEFLRSTEIPVPLLYRILNFARVIEVLYKNEDWYTHVVPELQAYISQILIEPLT